MKTICHVFSAALLAASFSLASTVQAETSTKSNATAKTPAVTVAPTAVQGGMSGMNNCPQGAMKDGKCAENGMGNDHMKQMHEHMQQMHPDSSAPASSATKKPAAASKPVGADDHAAHHPAQ